MRFPRFRLRTLMMVVAVIALVMAVLTAVTRRSVAFAQASQFHRSQAELGRERRCWTDSDGSQYLGYVLTARFYHHRALERKYQYAASHPWVPVPPDPSPPE
jgi:hypothetical protein